MRRIRVPVLLAIALAMSGSTYAAEKATVKSVLKGLNNPCGVAVDEGGSVFVSNSGAGEVLKVAVKGGAGKSSVAIAGYSLDVYGKGPMYNIGPLGLAFLKGGSLVVGGGDQKDGSELLRVYKLGKDPLKADDCSVKLGPLGPSDDTLKGEGNFYGLAVKDDVVYVTSNGDDTKGWVLKADLSSGSTPELKPFIKTKVATNVDAPVGVAVNKEGNVVVGQMGEINVPTDSLLTVYDATSGDMLGNAETGLYDIAALAYSPKTGNLYAVDFAWMDTTKGGLFRLDVSKKDGKLSVKAEKIVGLDKPTALTFAADGTLYVTVFGTAKEGSKDSPGELLAISGDL